MYGINSSRNPELQNPGFRIESGMTLEKAILAMYIGEIINVVASFGLPYKIRPVRFTWSGKLREVQDITYSWTTREGQSSIYHFSVTDGNTLYELSFNITSLLWRLENLEA